MHQIGLVGMPNAGKSTIFNLITDLSVPAENFPFCTIDKNVGIIEYKNECIIKLAELFSSNKIYPPVFKFVDIAGLIKGASKGEGLGNQFLAHVREVDLIMFVIRAFIDPKVAHVSGKISPKDDLETLLTELILKDLESIEKRLGILQKKARANSEYKKFIDLWQKIKQELSSGKTVYKYLQQKLDKEIVEEINSLFLLTAKPAVLVLNISYMTYDEDLNNLNKWKNELIEFFIKLYGNEPQIYFTDAKLLTELKQLNKEDAESFIQDLSFYQGVDVLVNAPGRALDLIEFYVGSSIDTRGFLVKRGTTAIEAARLIHSDLAEKFAKAQILKCKDIISLGSVEKVKEVGKMQTVGKTYEMQDGDYIIVL